MSENVRALRNPEGRERHLERNGLGDQPRDPRRPEAPRVDLGDIGVRLRLRDDAGDGVLPFTFDTDVEYEGLAFDTVEGPKDMGLIRPGESRRSGGCHR